MAVVRTLVAVTLVALFIGVASAARPVALGPPEKRHEKSSKSLQVQEAAASKLVKEHHPELAGLLRVLKSHDAKQYEAAIRDLSRTAERLEAFRRRGEQRYEIELQAWKVKSRIQLLTARLRMSDGPALRQELRAALREQAQLRIAALRHERRRAAERLAKLDEQLERLAQDPDAAADRQFQTLLRSLDETRKQLDKSAAREKPKPSERSKSADKSPTSRSR